MDNGATGADPAALDRAYWTLLAAARAGDRGALARLEALAEAAWALRQRAAAQDPKERS